MYKLDTVILSVTYYFDNIIFLCAVMFRCPSFSVFISYLFNDINLSIIRYLYTFYMILVSMCKAQ